MQSILISHSQHQAFSICGQKPTERISTRIEAIVSNIINAYQETTNVSNPQIPSQESEKLTTVADPVPE